MGYDRATSPLHFLHPALFNQSSSASNSPTSTSLPFASSSTAAMSKKQAQKRRSASDLSRLLDPAYLPAASAKTRRSASVTAYVDPSGDMHDPDYRHFPTLPAPGATRSGYHNGLVKGGSQPTYNTAGRRTTSPRPHFDWELALDESVFDDEYPPEPPSPVLRRGGYYNSNNYNNGYNSTINYSPRRSTSPVHLSPSRMRGASVSTTTTARSSAPGSASTGATSLGAPPSPALAQDCTLPSPNTNNTIVDDDEDFESSSPFADDAAAQARFAMEMERERALQRLAGAAHEKNCGRREERKRRRRLSREAEKERARRASYEAARAEAEEKDEEELERAERSRTRIEEEREDEDGEGEGLEVVRRNGGALEFTPSCGQALRRQWQALALSVRFGVFRARRRFARRVQSML